VSGGAIRVGKGVVESSIAAALVDVTLPDADGQVVRLGSLWESTPAVLVFLRHYG
jgi:hypothetical protein